MQTQTVYTKIAMN